MKTKTKLFMVRTTIWCCLFIGIANTLASAPLKVGSEPEIYDIALLFSAMHHPKIFFE